MESTEQKEEMFAKVMNYVAKSYMENPEELTGTISTSFLETLTHENLTEDYVINSNQELTDTYKHIVIAYGFEDFHSLYLFAVSNDEMEQVSKAGQKDFSKLKKVKRNVIRNGRNTTMTFYESHDGDSEEESSNSESENSEDEEPQVRPASELPSNVVGEFDKKVPIKDLKLLGKAYRSLKSSSDEEFNADCSQYLTLTDEEGNIKAMVGFTKDDEYVYLDFSIGDMYTSGVAVRAFYQLIRLARQMNLGAKMPNEDNRLQHSLAESSGFEEDEDGYYKAEAKDLEQLFGDV